MGFEKDPAQKAKVARARVYPSGPNVARFEFINKSRGLTPRWGTSRGRANSGAQSVLGPPRDVTVAVLGQGAGEAFGFAAVRGGDGGGGGVQ